MSNSNPAVTLAINANTAQATSNLQNVTAGLAKLTEQFEKGSGALKGFAADWPSVFEKIQASIGPLFQVTNVMTGTVKSSIASISTGIQGLVNGTMRWGDALRSV